MGKLGGILIFSFWLASMSWLFIHDVLPGWTALDAPNLKVNDWIKNEGRETQAGIFDATGRIGTVWSTYIIDEATAQREDFVAIERFPKGLAPIFVMVDSSFTDEGLLDEFSLEMVAIEAHLDLHGERFHSDFSFQLEVGSMDRTFRIPLTEAGMISDAFQPFNQLSDLEVGQSWRMQVFNPVAAITGVGRRFLPMVVSVTGRESIPTPDGDKLCFVVESSGAKAWVDGRGVVHRQEISLPVGGQMWLTPESFDPYARENALDGFLTLRREVR